MAMGKTKEWRMETAKLALAYMAGGDPPYQAARKTGFMRVSIMEEAIKELEKEENRQEQKEAAMEQVQGVEEPQTDAQSAAAEPVLAAEFRNSCFCVREYAPKDGKDGMVRIWSGNVPHFIFANINRVPMLIDLLKEVMTGKEAAPGMDEKEAIIAEKNVQIAKLQRELVAVMDVLQQESRESGAEELRERMGALTIELEMERQLNQKLKDKLVELLLET